MPLDNFSKVDFSKIDPSEYEEEGAAAKAMCAVAAQ